MRDLPLFPVLCAKYRMLDEALLQVGCLPAEHTAKNETSDARAIILSLLLLSLQTLTAERPRLFKLQGSDVQSSRESCQNFVPSMVWSIRTPE